MKTEKQSKEFFLFGDQVYLKYNHQYNGVSSKQKHTIVYVDNPFDPEDITWNGIAKRPEPSIKGEDPENDKIWRKYNKAEVEMQRAIISQAVSEGFLDRNLAQKIKWSRKAGCSCGCSPGWKTRDYGRQSISLSLISKKREMERKEKRANELSQIEANTLASMVI